MNKKTSFKTNINYTLQHNTMDSNLINFLLLSSILIFVVIQNHYPTILSKTDSNYTTGTLNSKDTLLQTDFVHGEFEFLSRYDNEVHIRIHRLVDAFLKHYYVTINDNIPRLYSKYYKHTHKIHKLEDLRGKILKELNDTVFLMSDHDFRFVHHIPTKLNMIEAYLTDKIKLLCFHLGMRYESSGVESVNMGGTMSVGSEF